MVDQRIQDILNSRVTPQSIPALPQHKADPVAVPQSIPAPQMTTNPAVPAQPAPQAQPTFQTTVTPPQTPSVPAPVDVDTSTQEAVSGFGGGLVNTILHKFLTKEAFAAAKILIAEADARFPGHDEAAMRHGWVYTNLVAFVERLDDNVSLIPYAGPILKALVDSPAVDRKEEALCLYAIESVYQALHIKN